MAKNRRTKAQRSAAAKAAWVARKARLAGKPLTPNEQQFVKKHETAHAELDKGPWVTPRSLHDFNEALGFGDRRIAYAVKEGNDIYVCFSDGKSLNRQHVSDASARKLLRELGNILL